jgi:hypothetical protein
MGHKDLEHLPALGLIEPVLQGKPSYISPQSTDTIAVIDRYRPHLCPATAQGILRVDHILSAGTLYRAED